MEVAAAVQRLDEGPREPAEKAETTRQNDGNARRFDSARRPDLVVVGDEHTWIIDVKIGRKLPCHRVHHGLVGERLRHRLVWLLRRETSANGDHRRRGYVPRERCTKTG